MPAGTRRGTGENGEAGRVPDDARRPAMRLPRCGARGHACTPRETRRSDRTRRAIAAGGRTRRAARAGKCVGSSIRRENASRPRRVLPVPADFDKQCKTAVRPMDAGQRRPVRRRRQVRVRGCARWRIDADDGYRAACAERSRTARTRRTPARASRLRAGLAGRARVAAGRRIGRARHDGRGGRRLAGRGRRGARRSGGTAPRSHRTHA